MPLAKSIRAVVTGAGSGLGRAFCHDIARRGGRVVAADIDLDSAVETVAALGAGHHARRCDVAKLDQVEALAGEAETLLGGVDLVVNNAGVAVGGRVGEVPIADWRWLMDVNLWGVIHGCHVFAPRLRAKQSGHIVNVASAAGFSGMPFMAPYCMSKAGVMALSEALAGELVGAGVGVTVVCPTFFATNIGRSARNSDESMKRLAQKLMDASKLTADDVARATLDAAAAGRLYAVPMTDARWLWRMKRWMPEPFVKVSRRLAAYQAKRLGFSLDL